MEGGCRVGGWRWKGNGGWFRGLGVGGGKDAMGIWFWWKWGKLLMKELIGGGVKKKRIW